LSRTDSSSDGEFTRLILEWQLPKARIDPKPTPAAAAKSNVATIPVKREDLVIVREEEEQEREGENIPQRAVSVPEPAPIIPEPASPKKCGTPLFTVDGDPEKPGKLLPKKPKKRPMP
jgi:hypothetical protein